MSMIDHAYRIGWRACMESEGGWYANPYPRNSAAACAYDTGFLDAVDAEDGEDPPKMAGSIDAA